VAPFTGSYHDRRPKPLEQTTAGLNTTPSSYNPTVPDIMEAVIRFPARSDAPVTSGLGAGPRPDGSERLPHQSQVLATRRGPYPQSILQADSLWNAAVHSVPGKERSARMDRGSLRSCPGRKHNSNTYYHTTTNNTKPIAHGEPS